MLGATGWHIPPFAVAADPFGRVAVRPSASSWDFHLMGYECWVVSMEQKRHLIVCCDGTWNSAYQSHDGVPTPTNVRLFYNALADVDDQGRQQKKRYLSGVGADGSAITRIVDGGTGHGLTYNVMNAYLWLASTFTHGDRIAAIGFSRGAYTARLLVGMLGRCGLLRFPQNTAWDQPGARWKAVTRVFEHGYASNRPAGEWSDGLTFHDGFAPHQHAACGSRIELVGVWETVGALGVPDSMAFTSLFDDDEIRRFYNTHLGAEVGIARHALALDEFRATFVPTLWTDPSTEKILPNNERVRQLWFPGSHSDVGGGYPQTGLSDGALLWMIEEAEATVGLRFDERARGQIHPRPGDVMHNSCTGLYERMNSAPRAVPRIDADPTVHHSATERWNDSPIRQDPYRTTHTLQPGQSVEVEVLAREPWFPTGLWLEPGTYVFHATGEWLDRDIPAGPDGVKKRPWRANLVYSVAEQWGRTETWWRMHKNPEADFLGTKRWESANWMALIGAVANGAGTKNIDRGTTDTSTSSSDPIRTQR